jgi:hypothetical protein
MTPQTAALYTGMPQAVSASSYVQLQYINVPLSTVVCTVHYQLLPSELHSLAVQ